MAKGALRLQMRVRSLISWTLRKEILLGGLGAITHIGSSLLSLCSTLKSLMRVRDKAEVTRLLAVKTEDGATSQGVRQPPEAGTGQGTPSRSRRKEHGPADLILAWGTSFGLLTCKAVR